MGHRNFVFEDVWGHSLLTGYVVFFGSVNFGYLSRWCFQSQKCGASHGIWSTIETIYIHMKYMISSQNSLSQSLYKFVNTNYHTTQETTFWEHLIYHILKVFLLMIQWFIFSEKGGLCKTRPSLRLIAEDWSVQVPWWSQVWLQVSVGPQNPWSFMMLVWPKDILTGILTYIYQKRSLVELLQVAAVLVFFNGK